MSGRAWIRCALGLLLALPGCREKSPTGIPPPRVVSLSAAGSRALLALGAGGSVVAVDAASRALIEEFAQLPEGEWSNLELHRPSLVVAPPLLPELEIRRASLGSHGIAVVEVAPHSFDEALALYRELAQELGLDEQAVLAPIRARGDALARLSVEALGRHRPRVAALVSIDPLVLAGGHSLVSDLLETVGADTITHGTAATRVPTSLEDLASRAPDWILLAPPQPLAADALGRLEHELAPIARIAFLSIEPDELWLSDPLPVARELRHVLQLDSTLDLFRPARVVK